jgi:hypothetical protein
MTDCPRADKVPYPTRALAVRALAVLRTKKGFGVAQVYRCRCGQWHIGRYGKGHSWKTRRGRKRTQRRRLKRFR